MKQGRVYRNTIVVCCLLMFLFACTNKKNTPLHRGWHNMNARYNGYFYSGEYLKEAITKVEKANKDDFSKLIPLFIYPSNTKAKDYYADFDKTIKKSSIVIQRHAIINPKSKEEIANACRWIDENYVLIGEANFYKRELFTALEMFEYVTKKYPNPEAKYGAMIWLIKANTEIGSFSKVETIIDDLRSAEDLPQDRRFKRDLAAAIADYYIKREDYPRAIVELKKAIELTKKKMVKARYNYVLAQLYEKLEDNKNASLYFAKVPPLHPLYDMEFNARINYARLYDSETGNTKAVKKQMLRMLRDAKNLEYRDQIYYALAEISYKEKDIPQAITYLNKSIRESSVNTTQKALSFLRRADIYFEKPDYIAAESSYDSAMTFLPKDYPDYDKIQAKKNSLTELVTNLNIIHTQDSLQRLGKLSEKEREKAIDKIIAKLEEEEERKKEEEERAAQNQQNQPLIAPTNTNTQSSGGSTWYFYNQTTVTFGISDFTKKWGNRKLEDNWFRSEKEQDLANNANNGDDEEEDTPATNKGADSSKTGDKTVASSKPSKNKKDRSYYLSKIPVTPAAFAKSDSQIVDAYYNAGTIYKEKLLNNTKSAEMFEELLKKYPENKYKLTCYYQLYRTYLAMNNNSRADYYKDLLLTKYGDSEYAKIIKNPSYAKDLMASKNEVERFYATTYQLYSEGNYANALANCIKADSSYGKSYLIPQFDFVKALCIGRTQDINAFESALTQVIILYPKEPVRDRAQEIIDLIRKQKGAAVPVVIDTTHAVAAKDTTQTKSKFVFKEDGDYYWVTIVQNGKGDIGKFKAKLSNLNTESFGTDDLNVSSVFLDITHQLISVKNFEGKDDAMDYFNFFKDNQEAFSDLAPGTYQSFIISAENYVTFYKDKNIEAYQQFFSQNFK